MNTNPIPVPIRYEPEADSYLFSGGLETKPTKIQASGGRKPPDSRSIDDRNLCLFLTSRKRKLTILEVKRYLDKRRLFCPQKVSLS